MTPLRYVHEGPEAYLLLDEEEILSIGLSSPDCNPERNPFHLYLSGPDRASWNPSRPGGARLLALYDIRASILGIQAVWPFPEDCK
jgi:hypothetical protein